jgi:hypothetical protein
MVVVRAESLKNPSLFYAMLIILLPKHFYDENDHLVSIFIFTHDPSRPKISTHFHTSIFANAFATSFLLLVRDTNIVSFRLISGIVRYPLNLPTIWRKSYLALFLFTCFALSCVIRATFDSLISSNRSCNNFLAILL